MELKTNISETEVIEEYISDYQMIMESSENSVVVKTEWQKEGDNFQKLSLYDNSYSYVRTLGSTTLIKSL